MANDKQKCEKCGKEGNETYGNPKSKRPEYLCFDCLDEVAPEYIDKYPGWREREREKRQRADQARKNFNHKGTEAQRGLF